MVSIDEVKKLAKLSHLKLNDEELKTYQKEIEAILGYIDQLADADVEGLEPTYQVSGNKNVMREDLVDEHLYKTTLDELMANAPDEESGQIKVKRVL